MLSVSMAATVARSAQADSREDLDTLDTLAAQVDAIFDDEFAAIIDASGPWPNTSASSRRPCPPGLGALTATLDQNHRRWPGPGRYGRTSRARKPRGWGGRRARPAQRSPPNAVTLE